MNSQPPNGEEDIRSIFNIEQVTTSWFWEIINHGQQNRDTLTQLMQIFSREDLIRFQTELEKTASYLQVPPFHLDDSTAWSSEVIESAVWLLSQGKPAFMCVWNDPAQFREIVKNWNDDLINSSYDSIAVNVYYSKFGEEMPPLDYQY